MYRNAYQRGMLTIFFSCGSKPLNIWETHTQDGYITRFLDQDIKSMVLEIGGTNVSTTYMVCPKNNKILGITMPFLVMIVKNLKKYFSFEVTILDDTGTRRRFRVSNFQSTTQIMPLCTAMPIGLSEGWNQIQFNLAEFTRRAYQKQFVEVQKLKINANIRLRRIYFAERLIPEDQLPPEYKLFFPLDSKAAKAKKEAEQKIKEDIKASTSQSAVADGPKTVSKVDVREGSKGSVHSIKKTVSLEAKPEEPIAEAAAAEVAAPVTSEPPYAGEGTLAGEEGEEVAALQENAEVASAAGEEPAGETPAPVEEAVTTTEEAAVPAEEAQPTAEDVQVQAEEIPAEEVQAPTEETLIHMEEAPEPAEETQVPEAPPTE